MEETAVRTLAARLFDLHGLTEKGWRFDLQPSETMRGVCHPGQRRIVLSSVMTPYMTDDDAEQTILHEIAHALTPAYRADFTPIADHGPEWKKIARSIGYLGSAKSPDPRVLHRLAGRAVDAPLTIGATVTSGEHEGIVVKITKAQVYFYDAPHIAMNLRDGVVVTAAATEETKLRAATIAERHWPTPAAGLRRGNPVVILGDGKFSGRRATIDKVNRTRYVITLDNAAVTLSAPFHMVQAA